MAGPSPSWQAEATAAAEQASQVLAPEGSYFTDFDSALFGRALGQVAAALARRPTEAVRVGGRFATGLLSATAATALRAMGDRRDPPFDPGRDKRFTDPAWEGNPLFFGLLQTYLVWSRMLHEAVEAAGTDELTARKAEFAVDMLVDGLAPTNFFATNPAALKRAFDSGGHSILRGLRNFLDDFARNGGMPRQVDASKFELGKNLAATPGQIVYRSDLMELIQYSPQTEKVYEIPLLFSPPWINKYYIMDLAPGRSFVEWAIKHGHTVFAISYRNPDATMRDVRLDDYMIEGPRKAIDVIHDITGASKVNMAGLCLGGTITAILLAYLVEVGDDRVNAVTLLNTMLDFSEPGQMELFTDLPSVERLEQKMRRRGFLEASELGTTFNLMRANDLIWNYVASNWLMGEDPPTFDILAWNEDSTRMPANMHSFYLRSCYLGNQLARGEMEIEGVRLRLSDVKQDMFVVGAENDHIAPWVSAYKTTKLVAGDVKFVLSSAGHIAGIVNPPSKKARYYTNDTYRLNPHEWRDTAIEHQGSWWEPWTEWIGQRAGDQVDPPGLGSDRYRPLEPAPGRYVRDK